MLEFWFWIKLYSMIWSTEIVFNGVIVCMLQQMHEILYHTKKSSFHIDNSCIYLYNQTHRGYYILLQILTF